MSDQRKIVLVAIPIAFVFVLLAVWQATAIFVGGRDNDRIVQLKSWNADFIRWTSCSPTSVLCDFSDDWGEVQAVTFSDRHIGEAEISLLLDLKSCIAVGFSNCTFQDRMMLCQLNAMRNLDTISFSNNSADDFLLKDILPSFGNIKFLYISDNKNISDASMDAIAKLPLLKSVGVSSTACTKAGTDRLHALRPDVEIIK